MIEAHFQENRILFNSRNTVAIHILPSLCHFFFYNQRGDWASEGLQLESLHNLAAKQYLKNHKLIKNR